MTPTKIRERLEETGDRIDTEEYVEALYYVRGQRAQDSTVRRP